MEKEGVAEKLYADGGIIKTIYRRALAELQEQRKKEALDRQELHVMEWVADKLESYWKHIAGLHLAGQEGFEEVKELFAEETGERERCIEDAAKALDAAFDFLEDAFGESQEMVVFVTELNTNFYSIWFLRENGCDKYYKYNKGLLLDERQEEILREMEEIEQEKDRGLV